MVFKVMLMDKVVGLEMWEINSMGVMIGIMNDGMGGKGGMWKWKE